MEGSAVASLGHRNGKSEETTIKPDFHMTGLQNLSNTCYINSVLQALNNIEPFRKILLSPELKKLSLKFGNPSGSALDLSDTDDVLGFQPSAETLPSPCASDAPESTRSRNSTGDAFHKTGTKRAVETSNRKRVRNGTDPEDGSKEKKVHKTLSLADRAAAVPGRAALTRSKRASLESDGPPVSISCELFRLLQKLSSGQYSILSPSTLVKVVWKLLPSFANMDQQD
eukprot:CAMPEP_0198233200 /NCGR_PEP_ID=MMETSP1445-20131203/116119_1 /TAXON_ID=36898 /ORGANISM="Pyramimonas sp., Strain CCMP2087" /LENGTH=226 /DNA_ID=CAMNT_0043913889 /DNA_START=654 /DNA_END=1331 /DNA_ORIENTATION=-